MKMDYRHRGRPLADRLALVNEALENWLNAVQEMYDLRDDQVAEVLGDWFAWKADVAVNFAPGNPGIKLPPLQGGAA